jgi:DNA-binding response OmpR family regulator
MKKVLVVDDDTDLLSVLKVFFLKKGYDIAVTTSCDEGLDIFYSFQPDLVLLDINVGSQNGQEMCRKIKAQTEYQHIPVIFISANHDALKLYVDYGADDAVKKPFDASQLLKIVELHL